MTRKTKQPTTYYQAAAYSGDTPIPGEDCPHKHRTEEAAQQCGMRRSRAWRYQVEAVEAPRPAENPAKKAPKAERKTKRATMTAGIIALWRKANAGMPGLAARERDLEHNLAQWDERQLRTQLEGMEARQPEKNPKKNPKKPAEKKATEKAAKKEGGQVIAVAFDRASWTNNAAREWLKRNKFKTGAPEHTANYWRFGQRPADGVLFARFRYKVVTSGRRQVKLVVGFPK